MCGIVGVFDGVAGSQIDPALIRRMADAIAHRGPDGDGFHIAPGIGLGHRRLAIIDLSGGAQPMATADGQTVVVFNGEIYNFREVAAELAAHGCVFRTRSDTEVILEAYRVWGPSCVTRLSGMFAFALWDATSQTLMLARDRIGKKPLYYRVDAGRRIAFASEIKALRVDPAFDRRLDPAAIEDFLGLGYVPDPRTIYAAVRKLPPAHTLVWRRGAQPEIRRYWALDLTETPVRSRAEAVDELRARLKAAVAARLISDVPLGAFLSGGVDSSAVVSTMAGLASAPVKTFTIGFGVADHDETGYARLIAEKYGTDHVEAFIDPQSFAASHDMIDRLVGIYDEPFGDNSALPTLRVCAEARKKVTVALSGDGGDEAFAGYRRYLWHVREQQVRSLVPSAIRGPLFSALAAIYPSFDNAPRFLRAGTTLRELAMGSAGAYFNGVSPFSPDLRAGIYTKAFRTELQGYDATSVIADLMRACPDDRPLMQAQYVDFHTWLPGRMLVKVDRASMAASLEVRNPFLDHSFFQWAIGLPADLKLDGGNYKAVLKQALEPAVPRHILYRPKQGFAMPVAQWLRQDWREVLRGALSHPAVADRGILEPAFVDRLYEEHTAGRKDHGAVLWSLLVLARFLATQAA